MLGIQRFLLRAAWGKNVVSGAEKGCIWQIMAPDTVEKMVEVKIEQQRRERGALP